MNKYWKKRLAPAKLGVSLFFATLFISLSCRESNSEFLNIESIQLQLDERLFLNNLSTPYALKILPESNLILICQKSSNYWVSVYNLNGEFQGEFIENGVGPNEQLSNISLSVDQERGIIYSFDTEKNYLYKYSLDSIKAGSFQNALIYNIKFNNLKLNQPVYISDNEFIDFVTLNEDNNTALAKFDTLGNIVPFAILPSYSHEIPYQIYPEAFFGNLQVIDDYIYFNYFWTDYIQKLNFNGVEVLSIHGPDQFVPAYEMRSSGNTIQPIPDFENARFGYLSRISGFGNHIAIGYSGKFIKEGEGVNKVIIFDSNLNPIKEYKFSETLLFFDVSDNYLFAYSSETEGELLRFNLENTE